MECKRAKVIMLPTEQYSKENMLVVREHDNKLCLHTDKIEFHGQNQHLYFITDDEIKEGDWMLMNDESPSGRLRKCFYLIKDQPQWDDKKQDWSARGSNYYTQSKEDKGSGFLRFGEAKKIIATTDQKLRINSTIRNTDGNSMDYGKVLDILPQPSQSFIEKYCKLGGIDEVLIEYTEPIDFKNKVDSRIKVDPDNTITIHSIKDSWQRRSRVYH